MFMNRNVKFLGIGLASLLFLSFRKKTVAITPKVSISSPVDNLQIRNCDPSGCGHYNAPRGSRLHNGIDIKAAAGSLVYAPISGKVRALNVYSGSSEMRGIEISNNNVKVKIFYVDSVLITGDIIKQGDRLGRAQDIAGYHNASGMTPHIHLEVYVNNVIQDPTNYFIT